MRLFWPRACCTPQLSARNRNSAITSRLATLIPEGPGCPIPESHRKHRPTSRPRGRVRGDGDHLPQADPPRARRRGRFSRTFRGHLTRCRKDLGEGAPQMIRLHDLRVGGPASPGRWWRGRPAGPARPGRRATRPPWPGPSPGGRLHSPHLRCNNSAAAAEDLCTNEIVRAALRCRTLWVEACSGCPPRPRSA